jgi:hypothetical protein
MQKGSKAGMGVEPMHNGFADHRLYHLATPPIKTGSKAEKWCCGACEVPKPLPILALNRGRPGERWERSP